jgi:uncharacterized OB-fold protein
VTLAEGPTLMTRIVDASPDSIAIGMPVQVQFQASDEGRMMPFFRPADQ